MFEPLFCSRPFGCLFKANGLYRADTGYQIGGYDEEEKYHLVGAAEANPVEGRISNESPLGKALLGAKVNQVVRVNAPNGIVEFRVVAIG